MSTRARIIAILLALLGAGGGGFLLGHASADDHAVEIGHRQGVLEVCPTLLALRHTIYDSVSVLDAHPDCWPLIPDTAYPLIRWLGER